MNKKLLVALLLTVFMLAAGTVYSGEPAMKGSMYIGLNVSGISFGYGITDRIVLEAKFQSQENVSVTGARAYYYFPGLQKTTGDRLSLFAGAELDAVTFTGDNSRGAGTAAELFAGGVYRATENILIGLDFGPALIGLSDNATAVSGSGTEFVMNLSVGYKIR